MPKWNVDQVWGLKEYFSTLSRKDKVQFLLEMDLVDNQVMVEADVQKAHKEMAKEFFAPKDAKGNIDVAEMQNRIGLFIMARAEQAEKLGQAMMEDARSIPVGHPIEQIYAAASERFKDHPEGKKAAYMKDYMYKKVIDGDLISTEAMQEMLKKAGKKAGDVAQTKEEFKKLLDEGFQKAIEEKKKATNTIDGSAIDYGANFASNKGIVTDQVVAQYMNSKNKVAAEYDILDHAYELREKINKEARLGGMKVANDLLYRKEVLILAKEALENTGRGNGKDQEGTWWHKNNSPEFNAVNTAMKNYTDFVQKGKNPDLVESARKTLVEAGLKYIDGKEKVRSSQFGRERFETVMTALHATMDKADFQALCDRINKKRGLTGKPDDENYVSEKKYAKKASMESRKTPLTEEMEDKIQNIEKYYGPNKPDGTLEYDLNAYDGIGDYNITSRQFAALVVGYAGTREAAGKGPEDDKLTDLEKANLQRAKYSDFFYEDKGNNMPEEFKPVVDYSKEQVNKALFAYRDGNKKPLANILAQTIRSYALAGRDELPAEKWAIQAEQKQIVLDFLAKDKDLGKLAKKQFAEITKNDRSIKGNEPKWEMDLKEVKATVEVGKLVGNASKAKKELESGKSLSEERKVELYADILKVNYLQNRINIKNGQELSKKEEIRSELGKIANEKGLNNDQVEAKGKAIRQQYYGNAQSMEDLINPKAHGHAVLTTAMKRVIRQAKITKLSLDEALNKLSDESFLKGTVRDKVLDAKEEAKNNEKGKENAKNWKAGGNVKENKEEPKALLPNQ